MRHKIFIAFLSLLTATSTLDMAKAQSLPYKNKNLPIEERVEDLLNRMTVDEKIAQIRHIHSSKIFNGQELDMKKLTDWAGNTSWGFVEGFPLTGDNCAKSMYLIQKYMVEKTRLGIPIFTVAESLHGAVHDGATIYPQNIALGSTFNPELARKKTQMISDDLHSMGFRSIPLYRRSTRFTLGTGRRVLWGRPISMRPFRHRGGFGVSRKRHIAHVEALRPARQPVERIKFSLSRMRIARFARNLSQTVRNGC